MDLLQIALVLLIILLGIFLSITGLQVYFILRDLKKALDRFTGGTVTPKPVSPRRLFKRK